jgi:hypothetical protein
LHKSPYRVTIQALNQLPRLTRTILRVGPQLAECGATFLTENRPQVFSFIQVAQFFCADLISGCVGNVSQELDFSFRYVRGFGAKFLLLQTLEDSRPQFKDLLFHRGSPPCFLPFDLLLWEGKDLAPGGIPTARPRLTLTTRILGTTSVQLRERKWSATILIPK